MPRTTPEAPNQVRTAPKTARRAGSWRRAQTTARQVREAKVELAANDPDLQAEELQRCRADIAYWINTYAVTYDPRETRARLEFILFPKQVAFLKWLAQREARQEDGVAEKSRDSGLTWLCCAYAVHAWLFREGFKGGFGSRKLDLVDRLGDLDSIFEKMRFLLRNLPVWMLPEGFSMSKHAALYKLINPANGATVTGEGGDEIGRGGRASLYIIDEHAFLRHAKRAESALSQSSRCIIRVSTPNGPGNEFYNKRFSGTVPVFTFHWRDDPRKSPAWYEREKQRIGDPVIVAQEIDINYTASIEGVAIPAAWVRAAVELREVADMETGAAPVAALDIAEAGRCRTVLGLRRGPVVSDIIDWGQLNTTQTAFHARDEALQRGATLLSYDCIGVGAGVRGTLDSIAEGGATLRTRALNGGETPSDTVWPDGRTSRERFLNARAEWWWLLRIRFEEAYEFREHGTAHPPDTMISIPNHPQLIAQLSLPLYTRTETGKIQLESKPKMAQRGVASPDFADMLAYLFAPEPLAKPWYVS